MRVRAAVLSSLVLGVLLIGACSSEQDNRPIVLNPSLHVVDTEKASSATVTPDSLRFPAAGNDALLDRKPGDILAAGYGSTKVFLRTVVGVHRDGESIVVDTTQASLADAIQSGEAHVDFGSFDDPSNTIQAQDFGGLLGKTIDLTGLRIDESGDPHQAGGVQAKIHATPNSHLRFSPHVTGDLGFQGFHLQHGRVVAETDIDEELEIDLKLLFLASISKNWVDNTLVTIDQNRDVKLWENEIWSVTRPVWTWIGSLPTYIELKLAFKVGCYFGVQGLVEATARETYQDHLRFGVELDNDQWNAFGDHAAKPNASFDLTQAAGSLYAKCYVQPRLDVKVDEMGGPFFLINLYGRPQLTAGLQHISVPTCSADAFLESRVDLGIDGAVGGKFDPFDLHKIKYEIKGVIFDASVPVFDKKWDQTLDLSSFCADLTSSGSGGTTGGGGGSPDAGTGGPDSGGGGSGSGGAGSVGGPPVLPCGAGNDAGPDNGTCGSDGRVYYCLSSVWHLKDDCLAKGQRCQIAASGVADSCVPPPFGPPALPCGAGNNAGPDNGTCGSDGRVYYCYQSAWHLKDDCVAKHEGCNVAASGVADYCQ